MAIVEIDVAQINEERFWSYVAKGAADDCWTWEGGKCRGYGHFACWVDGRRRTFKAHRVAYVLTKGSPGARLVCHHCDNPSCVNPDHLFAGTWSDNSQDRDKKGRSGSVFVPKHKANHQLSDAECLEIIRLLNAGMTEVEVGKRMGCSAGHAGMLKRGKTRKYLQQTKDK